MSILAFAYACEPGRGSEPGAGWNWARLVASIDTTHVITRANNAGTIEAGLIGIPERDRLTFVYVDLPPWARFWKKGPRGARTYYLLWQLAALKAARRLQRCRAFHTVWHLTLANMWMGSLAPLAGGRFVLGPVGGGVAPPLGLLPGLGFRGLSYELARAGARTAGRYLNPLARLAWHHADLVLVQNPESRAWIPRRHRHKTVVFPNPLITRAPTSPPRGNRAAQPTLLFAGRLLPWKGAWLALRTLEFLAEWRLIICGSGPDEARLRRLAEQAGLSRRVVFRGWVEQQELTRTMQEEADVFILPSLHEDASFVVAEASAVGLPVVCLDRGGPPLLGGYAVKPRSPRVTARALAAAVERARSDGPRKVADRAEQLIRLREILASRGLLADASPPATS